MKIKIKNQLISLKKLRAAWSGPVDVSLGVDARRRVAESNELIDEIIAAGDCVYGVNTGFGMLAKVHIDGDELGQLQENLVRSHAVGVGSDLDDDIVRLVMLLKVIALAEGFSGVRLELVDALCALINHQVYPCIPAKGSVGASGDLAPLAHRASLLIGTGEARVNGEIVPAAAALAKAGLKPLKLAPKEGLALLNGTQVSTALALAAVFRTENVLAAVLVVEQLHRELGVELDQVGLAVGALDDVGGDLVGQGIGGEVRRRPPHQVTGDGGVEVAEAHLADADEVVVPHRVELVEGRLARDQDAHRAAVLDN